MTIKNPMLLFICKIMFLVFYVSITVRLINHNYLSPIDALKSKRYQLLKIMSEYFDMTKRNDDRKNYIKIRVQMKYCQSFFRSPIIVL